MVRPSTARPRARAQDEAIFFVALTVDGRPDGPHPERREAAVEGRIAVDPAPPIISRALARGDGRVWFTGSDHVLSLER